VKFSMQRAKILLHHETERTDNSSLTAKRVFKSIIESYCGSYWDYHQKCLACDKCINFVPDIQRHGAGSERF
jgi:hypothetical protein